MTNQVLIQNFEQLVKDERRVMRAVIEHIAEIMARRAYLDLGYDSIYTYLTAGLKYSDSSAFRRIEAARVLRQQPQIAAKIQNGSLNLMQLAEVSKLSRQTQKPVTLELLAKIESQPKSVTQQILAENFDVPVREFTTSKVQKDHTVRLEVTFSAEQFAQLEKAKSLLSHICPDGDWAKVLAELARRECKKMEPKRIPPKIDTAPSRALPPVVKQSAKSIPLLMGMRPRRKYISVRTKREIFQRAEGQCEHVDPNTQRRCTSRYQPQMDHIHSLAKGGSNEERNFQLLCAAHNRAKG